MKNIKRFGTWIAAGLVISSVGLSLAGINNSVNYRTVLNHAEVSNESPVNNNNQFEETQDFIFENNANDNGKIKLIGLTDQGKQQRVLFIPKEVDHIANKSFEGCSPHLSKIFFGNYNVVIEENAFAGINVNSIKCYSNDLDFLLKIERFGFKNAFLLSESSGFLLVRANNDDVLVGIGKALRIGGTWATRGSVLLPPVTKIDHDAFSHISPNITKVFFDSGKNVAIADGVFQQAGCNVTIYFVNDDQTAVNLVNSGVDPNEMDVMIDTRYSVSQQQGIIYKNVDGTKVLIGLTRALKLSSDPIEIPEDIVRIEEHALDGVNQKRIRRGQPQANLSAADQLPNQEQLPTNNQLSNVEQAVDQEQSPIADQLPTNNQLLTVDQSTNQEQSPIADQSPTNNQLSNVEQAVDQEQSPIADQLPTEDGLSTEEQFPTEVQSPTDSQFWTADPLSDQEQSPIADQSPTNNQSLTVDQSTNQEQSPIADQLPTEDELSTEEQFPTEVQSPTDSQFWTADPLSDQEQSTIVDQFSINEQFPTEAQSLTDSQFLTADQLSERAQSPTLEKPRQLNVQKQDKATNTVPVNSLPQDEQNFIIKPFQDYKALVGLGEASQEREFLEIPADVDFIRKEALANSRAFRITFLRDGLVNIAGGAKLPLNAQYCVYDQRTARQLISVGVVGRIEIRQDQSIEHSDKGLIVKTAPNGQKSLVGLTPAAQEWTQLIINQDDKIIADDFFENSQAMFVKFVGTKPIEFNGTFPDAEYEVENAQGAIKLIKAGVKRKIFVKENKVSFSEEDLRNFVFDVQDNEIVLTDLNDGISAEETLSIPLYVTRIASGALDKFKGSFVFMWSTNEIAVDKATANLVYYVNNETTLKNLINAGAAKDKAFMLLHAKRSSASKVVLINSILIALTLIGLGSGVGIYAYLRKKKKAKPKLINK